MRGWGDAFPRHAANSSLTVNFVAHPEFKRSEGPLRRFPAGISLTAEREIFFAVAPIPETSHGSAPSRAMGRKAEARVIVPQPMVFQNRAQSRPHLRDLATITRVEL